MASATIPAPASLLLLFAAVACGDYPRDPDRTLDRIAETRKLRVGLVASSGSDAETARLIAMLEASTGASADLTTGATEPLLLQLEAGALDLVVAPFDASSPWGKRVTLGPPIAIVAEGDPPHHLMPATMNGENGWAMRVHAAAGRIAEAR